MNTALEREAKQDLKVSWDEVSLYEKRSIDFGKKCYEWQNKLAEEGLSIRKIWKELDIPRQTAGRHQRKYTDSVGLTTPQECGPDRAKSNSDIIENLIRRLEELKQAVEPVANDWKGWAAVAPDEVRRLQQKLKDVGEYFMEVGS